MERRFALAVATLTAWWFGFRVLVPWVQRVTAFERISDGPVRTILGHWFFWQLPGVLLCVSVWIAGSHLGLLPPLRRALELGGSARRVVVNGLLAGCGLVGVTIALGAALKGSFGLYLNPPKMIGDVASNLYEEVVYRGLVFCSFYGL